MLTRFTFQDIQNNYEVYKSDIRVENFIYIINYVLEVNCACIDIHKSYIEVDNYMEPSSFCGIYFVPHIDNIHNFSLYIWLDISYKSVFVGFENYGENCYAERLEYNDEKIYEKCFNEIVLMKFQKEYWGEEGKIKRIIYKGFYRRNEFSEENTFGFIIKPTRFWEKKNILLKTQLYGNIDECRGNVSNVGNVSDVWIYGPH